MERIAKYSCLIIVVCFLLLSEDKQLDERRGGQAAIERDQYSKLSNNDRAGVSVGRSVDSSVLVSIAVDEFCF